MARPISYDPDAAEERAIDLFWRCGYRAVSVDDLVRTTGLNRHSLYSRYGNKYGLLQAALKRYCDQTIERLRRPLEGPGSPRERIERLMSLRDPDCPDAYWQRMLKQGCFGFRTASELRHERPELDEQVEIFGRELEALLAKTIREGQEQGEFRRDRTAEELASVLTGGFMAPLILPPTHRRNRAFLSVLR
jgi:TetR/AcrR family transcriptional repressor of nem operon